MDPRIYLSQFGVCTIFGSWFKEVVILKLERASHLAKDAGELAAALGAIMVFTLPFNEQMISQAFGVVFLSYFWGHFLFHSNNNY